MKIRELVTVWGFDIDDKPLKDLELKIKELKRDMKAISYLLFSKRGLISGFRKLRYETGKRKSINQNFKIIINKGKEANNTISRTELLMKGLNLQFNRLSSSANRLKSTGKILGGVFLGSGGLVYGLKKLLEESGRQEEIDVTYKTLIKNGDKAKETLKDLYSLAAKTPFTIPQVEKAGIKLLGYSVEANNLVETIRIMGDIASGVGKENLPYLIRALGQVKQKGVFKGDEKRQFENAGISILNIISETTGKSVSELVRLQEAQKITYKDVFKALQTVTSKSGRFNNLMVKISKTWPGLISNVYDRLIILARAIGKELLPEAKKYAQAFLSYVEVNEELIKSKAIKYIKILLKNIKDLTKSLFKLFKGISLVVKVFGGLDNALRIVIGSFKLLISLQLLSFVNNLVLSFLDLKKVIAEVGLIAGLAQTSPLFSTSVKLYKKLKKVISALMAIAAASKLVFALVVIAIAGIVLVIQDFYTYLKGGESVFGEWAGAIGRILSALASDIVKLVSLWKERISDGLNFAKFLFRGILNEIKNDIRSFFQDNMISKFFNFVTGNLSSGLSRVKGFLGMQKAGLSSMNSSINNNNRNINVNPTINISVPEGTPTSLIERSVKNGISSWDSLLRETMNMNKPIYLR